MTQKLRAIIKAILLTVKVKNPIRIRIKALKVVLITNRL
jgi:hypothetical protein